MKKFGIGILVIVLVFATFYTTGETFNSPSTGYVDVYVSAYLFAYLTAGNQVTYYGSASASVYATEISGGDTNGGSFTIDQFICNDISWPAGSSFEFYNGVGFSTSVALEGFGEFHCEAGASIYAQYGGYDYDWEQDEVCSGCNPG